MANTKKHKELSENNFFKLLSLRSNVSEKSTKAVYNALIDYVIENLELNDEVSLPRLLKCKIRIRPSRTRYVPNIQTGERVLRLCNPSVEFQMKPQASFRQIIREYIFKNDEPKVEEILPRKRKDIIKRQLLETYTEPVNTDVVLNDNLGEPIGADELWQARNEITEEDITEDDI